MNLLRPVAASNKRTTISLASDPECPNHTFRGILPGIIEINSSAKAIAGSEA